MTPHPVPLPQGERGNIVRKEIPSPLRGEGVGGGGNEMFSHFQGGIFCCINAYPLFEHCGLFDTKRINF